jgi:dTDP-4-amino-4,6-dideoxygalactose transaminase
MNDQRMIPFHVPIIGDEEIAEVVATLRSGWITTGPRTHQFEEDFRNYIGAKHALALNSGTAALHVALAGLRIGPGDEVITTPLTFCATVNTIIHVGATPVLADIGPDGNIDPASIAQRITARTRAILPVHYAGQACDMDAIWKLARTWNLKVVEDAAHASGTYYQDAHVGSAEASQSDAVAFSFYATKNLTSAEGGMVTTSDGELCETMRRLALHGINKDAWSRYSANGKWFYTVQEPGFKYNLTDLASAIAIHQLRKLESFVEKRTQLATLYNRLFADVEELETPAEETNGRHSWHLYVLRLNLDKLDIGRDEFIDELRQTGVGVSVHFIPIPLHPFYQQWANETNQQCPRALEMYQRIISLPLHPGLSEEDVTLIAERVKKVVSAHKQHSTSSRKALAAVARVA